MALEKKYKTNVFWQDVQHRQLIELSNKMANSNTEDFDPSTYSYTLGFLVMYANQHFNLEEEYMHKYGYPETDTHKIAHKAFIQSLKDFRIKYKSYSEEAADKLSSSVLTWIKKHILGVDKKLGSFLIEKEKEALLKQ